MQTNSLILYAAPAVIERVGSKKSLFFARVNQGLFPKPIKIPGTSSSRWPSHEVDEMVDALAANLSVDELKAVVKKIEDRRIQRRAEVVSSIPKDARGDKT